MNNSLLLVQLWIVAICQGFPQNINTVKKLIREEDRVTIESCGNPKIPFPEKSRIVNGNDVSIRQFPWQAALRACGHFCGATILNERYVLTAAHCVHRKGNMCSETDLKIVIGIDNLDENSIFPSYEVEKIIVHENYGNETIGYDIALMKLKEKIDFSINEDVVNGICLPQQNQNVTGTAIVTGWGRTSEGGKMSNVLQAVQLPVVSNVNCETIYGKNVFSENMICAGKEEGGEGPCNGDSGGPLVQKNENGRYVLLGIVSWGIGCARPDYPGVFASVPYFVDWILKNID